MLVTLIHLSFIIIFFFFDAGNRIDCDYFCAREVLFSRVCSLCLWCVFVFMWVYRYFAIQFCTHTSKSRASLCSAYNNIIYPVLTDNLLVVTNL